MSGFFANQVTNDSNTTGPLRTPVEIDESNDVKATPDTPAGIDKPYDDHSNQQSKIRGS